MKAKLGVTTLGISPLGVMPDATAKATPKKRGGGRLGALGALLVAAWGLGGCALDPADQALLDSVVTALPSEVEGCSFVGNVDNSVMRSTIEGARAELRLQAGRLGANHVVETHLVVTPYQSFLWSERDFDFPGYASRINASEYFLSGRAYLCPEGKGVKLLKRPKDALPQPQAAAPEAEAAVTEATATASAAQ